MLLKSRGMTLAELARRVNVHKATVTRWSKSIVPVDRVKEVERETGIPAQSLRPDVARLFSQKPTKSRRRG